MKNNTEYLNLQSTDGENESRWYNFPDQQQKLADNASGLYFNLVPTNNIPIISISPSAPVASDEYKHNDGWVQTGPTNTFYRWDETIDEWVFNGSWGNGEPLLRHDMKADLLTVTATVTPPWILTANQRYYDITLSSGSSTEISVPEYVADTGMLKVFKGIGTHSGFEGTELQKEVEYVEETGTSFYSTTIILSNSISIADSDVIRVVYNDVCTFSNSVHYQQVNTNIVKFLFNEMCSDDITNLKLWGWNFDKSSLNPHSIFDVKSDTTITLMQVWDPARGWHYYNADHIIDLRLDVDPALYNNSLISEIDQLKKIAQEEVLGLGLRTAERNWGHARVGTTYLDTNNLDYVPYYDPFIIPKITDRLISWGQLADWSEYKIYTWVESEVHPSEWNALAISEENDLTIPQQLRKAGRTFKTIYEYNNGKLVVAKNVHASFVPLIDGTGVDSNVYNLPDSFKLTSNVLFVEFDENIRNHKVTIDGVHDDTILPIGSDVKINGFIYNVIDKNKDNEGNTVVSVTNGTPEIITIYTIGDIDRSLSSAYFEIDIPTDVYGITEPYFVWYDVPGIKEKTQITTLPNNNISLKDKYFSIYSSSNEESRYNFWYLIADELEITTVADVNGSLGGECFVLNTETESYYVWYDVPPAPEKTTVTTVADVNGSLGGKYFNIAAPNPSVSGGLEQEEFYVWYNVTSKATSVKLDFSNVTNFEGKYFDINSTTKSYRVWFNDIINPTPSSSLPPFVGKDIIVVDYGGYDYEGGSPIAPLTITRLDILDAAVEALRLADADFAHCDRVSSGTGTVHDFISITYANDGYASSPTAGTVGVGVQVIQTGVDPSEDPRIEGKQGIRIDIEPNSSANNVATETRNVINGFTSFNCSTVTSSTFVITNNLVGDVLDANSATSGFSIVVESGIDESVDPEIPGAFEIRVPINANDSAPTIAVKTVSAITTITELIVFEESGDIIYSVYDGNNDIVSVDVNNTGFTYMVRQHVGTEPSVGGTHIPVTIARNASAGDVATETSYSINALGVFNSWATGNILTVINNVVGDVIDAKVGTSLFIITVVEDGVDDSIEPVVSGRQAIPVYIEINSSSEEVAERTKEVLNNKDGITTSDSGLLLSNEIRIITDGSINIKDNARDVNTGFSISTIDGIAPEEGHYFQYYTSFPVFINGFLAYQTVYPDINGVFTVDTTNEADTIEIIKFVAGKDPTLDDETNNTNLKNAIDSGVLVQDYQYSTEPYIDFLGNQQYRYYFWVEDKITKGNKSMSPLNAQNSMTVLPIPYVVYDNVVSGGDVVLEDGSVSYLPPRFNQAVLRGLGTIINDDNRYVMRWKRDATLRDQLAPNSLAKKNVHEQWEIIRRAMPYNIPRWLWDKITESMIGHILTDPTTRVPSYQRELYDLENESDTQYGIGSGQTFTDGTLALRTIITYLNDSKNDFTPIDINVFFDKNTFNTNEGIVNAMDEIYNNFPYLHVNGMFFEVLLDAFSKKSKYEDIFKTSMISVHGIRPIEISGIFDD